MASQEPVAPLVSFSLTHVQYDPTDPLSLLSATLALAPQALLVIYTTLAWSTREAEILLLFAGQLACEALNFALKRLIKQERPRRVPGLGKGYGMPSSHAQFAAFWAVSVCLFLLVRHAPKRGVSPGGKMGAGGVNVGGVVGGGATLRGELKRDGDGATQMEERLRAVEAYSHGPWAVWERQALGAATLAVAGAVGWSRVYLGYHTPEQVAVGLAAGSASAVGWFLVTSWARSSGLMSWALQLPPARWMRIRDLVVEEDLQTAGWERWEARRLQGLEKRQ